MESEQRRVSQATLMLPVCPSRPNVNATTPKSAATKPERPDEPIPESEENLTTEWWKDIDINVESVPKTTNTATSDKVLLNLESDMSSKIEDKQQQSVQIEDGIQETGAENSCSDDKNDAILRPSSHRTRKAQRAMYVGAGDQLAMSQRPSWKKLMLRSSYLSQATSSFPRGSNVSSCMKERSKPLLQSIRKSVIPENVLSFAYDTRI